MIKILPIIVRYFGDFVEIPANFYQKHKYIYMQRSQVPKEQLLEKFKEQIQKNQLLKSSMVSRFDLLLTIIKLQFRGTEQQKVQQLNRRITKFFDYGGYSIDISKDHFCSRHEPHYDKPLTVPIKNQLVLFGVDFLSTRRIKNLCGTIEPKVKWINNSNCKLMFQSANDARLSLNLMMDPQKQQPIPEMQQLPRKWFHCKCYTELTFKRILQCRYATSQELCVQGQPSPNYQAYRRARKMFQNDVLNKYRKPLQSLKSYVESRGERQRQMNRERSRNKFNRNRFERNKHEKQPKQGNNIVRIKDSMEQEVMSENYSFILDPCNSSINEGSVLNKFQNMNLQISSLNNHSNKDIQIIDDDALSFMEQPQQNDEKISLNMSFSYLDYISQEQAKEKQKRLAMQRKNNKTLINNCANVIQLDD